MLYLYLISLVLLAAYIVYAVKTIKDVPWSLSDTYYQLKKRGRPAWLFQAAMIIPAITLMPVWIECSKESIQCLAFLACGGLMFVGSAPLFKEEFQSKVHYTGTAIAGIATVLWVCLSGMWYLPAIAFTILVYLVPSTIMIITGIFTIKKMRLLFWAEMATFICAYVGILLN